VVRGIDATSASGLMILTGGERQASLWPARPVRRQWAYTPISAAIQRSGPVGFPQPAFDAAGISAALVGSEFGDAAGAGHAILCREMSCILSRQSWRAESVNHTRKRGQARQDHCVSTPGRPRHARAFYFRCLCVARADSSSTAWASGPTLNTAAFADRPRFCRRCFSVVTAQDRLAQRQHGRSGIALQVEVFAITRGDTRFAGCLFRAQVCPYISSGNVHADTLSIEFIMVILIGRLAAA